MGVIDRLVRQLSGTVRTGHAPSLNPASGEQLATGLAELDAALEGGLPRGRLTELVGSGSTGATTLAHRLVARVTTLDGCVAWIDGADAFDPASASIAGVDLSRLLWVRPPDLDQGFTAAELVLATGGFPLVLLDIARSGSRLAGAPRTWLRLSRAAQRSRSALVVLRGEGGSFSALRLELSPAQVVWDRAAGTPALLDGLIARVAVARHRGHRTGKKLSLRLEHPSKPEGAPGAFVRS